MEAIQFFLSKSGQKFGLQSVHSLQILKMHKDVVNQLSIAPNLKVICCHDVR